MKDNKPGAKGSAKGGKEMLSPPGSKKVKQGGKEILSPPGSKKLKQARLPFAVLPVPPKTEANATETNVKKRKLSEDASGPVKPLKTPRSEDKKTPKVTTPTSAENKKEKTPTSVKNKKEKEKSKSDLLDKFVASAKDGKKAGANKDEKKAKVEVVVDLTADNTDEAGESSVGKTDASIQPEIASSTEEKKEKQMEVDASNEQNKEKITMEEKSKESKEKVSTLTAKDSSKPATNLKTPEPNKAKKAKTPQSARLSKEEKDRLLKEKEEKRQKEKEEKERQKQEEKEKKEQEKEEKKRKLEEEKKEKLEQKKKELEEKQKQKEEEKKQKLEEKKLEQEKKDQEKERLKEEKEQEKQRQKEEKEQEKQRLKEEKEKEKEKAELEKLQVTRKQKSLFQNFFTKKEFSDTAEEAMMEDVLFMPFQLKADTKLAPINRIEESKRQEKTEAMDSCMDEQNEQTLYLDELKRKKRKLSGKEAGTWPYVADDSCCMILDGEGGVEETSTKPKKERMKVKLLQFHENNRPAYYGTWTKTSNAITGRRPGGKDTGILDYEVDSDDEWEEEEPGESLSASEDDDKEEETKEDDDEDDGFFVPHGYLSEGEGCEDEEEDDVTPARLKARQLAKAKAFEMSQQKKTEVLKPVAVGCCWNEPGKTLNLMEQVLQQFKMVILRSSFPIPVVEMRGNESEETTQKANKKDKRKLLAQNVPKEAFPDLIKLVHGNKLGLPKLVKEFREFWYRKEGGGGGGKAADTPSEVTEADADGDKDTSPKEAKKYSISKRQLEMTIKEIAVYEKRAVFKFNAWYINEEVLEKHGIKDLPVPTEWQWITRVPPPPQITADQAPSPALGGRTTPKLDPTNKAVSSITKFTVPGLMPPVLKPTPVKPTPVKPSEEEPSKTKTIAQMFSKAPPPKAAAVKPLKPEIATANIIAMDEGEGDSSDCVIVGAEMKSDKHQPSVKSMFQPAAKRKSTGKTEPASKKKAVSNVKKASDNNSAKEAEKPGSVKSANEAEKPGSLKSMFQTQSTKRKSTGQTELNAANKKIAVSVENKTEKADDKNTPAELPTKDAEKSMSQSAKRKSVGKTGPKTALKKKAVNEEKKTEKADDKKKPSKTTEKEAVVKATTAEKQKKTPLPKKAPGSGSVKKKAPASENKKQTGAKASGAVRRRSSVLKAKPTPKKPEDVKGTGSQNSPMEID